MLPEKEEQSNRRERAWFPQYRSADLRSVWLASETPSLVAADLYYSDNRALNRAPGHKFLETARPIFHTENETFCHRRRLDRERRGRTWPAENPQPGRRRSHRSTRAARRRLKDTS